MDKYLFFMADSDLKYFFLSPFRIPAMRLGQRFATRKVQMLKISKSSCLNSERYLVSGGVQKSTLTSNYQAVDFDT